MTTSTQRNKPTTFPVIEYEKGSKIKPFQAAFKELEKDKMENLRFPKTEISNEKIILVGSAKDKCDILLDDENMDFCEFFKSENKRSVKAAKIKLVKKDAKKNSAIMTLATTTGIAVGSVGWAGGPIGGVIGMGIGGITGIAIGSIYINHKVTKKINLHIIASDKYQVWRSSAISQQIFPVFKMFLDASEEFKTFLCPLTKDLISLPLRAPDGYTYEKDAIFEYLKKNTGSDKDLATFKSPVNARAICKATLVFDFDYCIRLIQKTKQVYLEICKHRDRLVLKHGFDAVEQNTIQTMKYVQTQVKMYYFDLYEDQVNKNEISEQKRAELIAKTKKEWDWGF